MPVFSDDDVIYHDEDPGNTQYTIPLDEWLDPVVGWKMKRLLQQEQLDDGLYLVTIEQGAGTGDFSYSSMSVGNVFQVTDTCLAKIVEVHSASPGVMQLKIEVVNGVIQFGLLLSCLAVAAVIIAVGWTITKMEKLSSSVSGEELATDKNGVPLVDKNGNPIKLKKGLFDSLTQNVGTLLVIAGLLFVGVYAWKHWSSSSSLSE
jgi:hypothetical protein